MSMSVSTASYWTHFWRNGQCSQVSVIIPGFLSGSMEVSVCEAGELARDKHPEEGLSSP